MLSMETFDLCRERGQLRAKLDHTMCSGLSLRVESTILGLFVRWGLASVSDHNQASSEFG